MAPRLVNIQAIVESQLCCGCGACVYAEPKRFTMLPVLEYGNRPVLVENPASETGDAVNVCPAIELSHLAVVRKSPGIIDDLYDGWGPVLGVWEGYATNDQIRYTGSSGGLVTALSAYCLEKDGMKAVLHTAANKAAPYLNMTVLSRSVEELISHTGSRYSPASPVEGLGWIENAEGPCVFIGKPCDVAAVQKAKQINDQLQDKIGITLSFFCAGTPSTRGNIEYLKNQGVIDIERLFSLRYRGNGWPGEWVAKYSNDRNEEEVVSATYSDSWGYLQKYRQWRCYICPDHTGEFADISLGDPWYRSVVPGELGKSLIVARTQRGLDLVRSAEKAGYVVLERNDPQLLPQSQPNLLATRGAVWARVIVMRLFGLMTPKYSGFSMFMFWLSELSLKEKLQSFLGTVKRIFVKKLYRPLNMAGWNQGHER